MLKGVYRRWCPTYFGYKTCRDNIQVQEDALLALADAVEVGAVTKVNGDEVLRVVEHVQPIHVPLGWIAFLACSSRMRARQRRCATNDMRLGLHE
jgi:hypothetical protein